MKRNAQGRTLEHLRLHRTKTLRLIDNVISPSLQEAVKDDLAGKKYSLIVDESIDISIQKSLAICAKYYSESEQKIIVTFMGIVPILHGQGKFSSRLLSYAWNGTA